MSSRSPILWLVVEASEDVLRRFERLGGLLLRLALCRLPLAVLSYGCSFRPSVLIISSALPTGLFERPSRFTGGLWDGEEVVLDFDRDLDLLDLFDLGTSLALLSREALRGLLWRAGDGLSESLERDLRRV